VATTKKQDFKILKMKNEIKNKNQNRLVVFLVFAIQKTLGHRGRLGRSWTFGTPLGRRWPLQFIAILFLCPIVLTIS